MESLCWKGELLALEDFSDVQVEEVTIEDGLDNTSNNSDQVEEAFKVISPDPVDQIQSTVATKSKQVVGGDSFRFTRFTDHKQLWEDGNWFQVDTEGPEDFQGCEVMVDEEGKSTDRHDEELCSECVVVSVIGGLELHVDEIDGGVGAWQVDHLHDGVVGWDKVSE